MKKNTMEIGAKRFKSLVIVLGGGAFAALALQGFLSFMLTSDDETVSKRFFREETSVQADHFVGISLEARAAYVIDLTTKKVLFAKNEHEKLPLASVTKLMTALVARDHMRNDVVVTLSKDDLAAEGDSGLHPGERWRMGDLLDVMLLISSNDAAHAVAGFVGGGGAPNANLENERMQFVGMMNEKAKILSLTTMEFFNESGLDIDTTKNGLLAQAGGYGSAHDVAVLMATLWQTYPTTLEITTRKDARIISQDKIAHILPNTNEAAGRYPGLVASKTGFTDLAGGNLVILFDVGIGHPIVAVVLGSSYKGRFEDMRMLVQATLAAVR